jgi:hypothetical protein
MLWFFFLSNPCKKKKTKQKQKVEAFPNPSVSYETSYLPTLHQKHFLYGSTKMLGTI